MEHRNNIPVLALLGLSFTGCTQDDPPNPIVGEWNAIQFDGMKLPQVENSDSYSSVYGLRMEVEDDLAGDLVYYSVVDYGDYEYRTDFGSALVVDDSEAPKYRFEVVKDLFGGGDYYYDTSDPAPVTSDGYYTGGYAGDDDPLAPADELAAPTRPAIAPAELVLTCTLDQDILTCAADGGEPMSLVFKRKRPVEPDGG